MCNLSKKQLLTLYFHEGDKEEEEMIQQHVSNCTECQDFLLTLEQTDLTLAKWTDIKPEEDLFFSILERIPEKETYQKKNHLIKPIIMIFFTIISLLGLILFVQKKIPSFPLWETIKNWEIINFLGTLGVTSVIFILGGIFISFIIAPILIMEIQHSKQNLGLN